MADPNSDGVGFVTAFEIPEDYLSRFEIQTVGLKHHQELWVPAEQLDEFNHEIINGIRVEKSFIGQKFLMNDKIRNVLNGI